MEYAASVVGYQDTRIKRLRKFLSDLRSKHEYVAISDQAAAQSASSADAFQS